MNHFVALMYHEILGPNGFEGRAGQSVQVANGYQDVLPPPLHVHEADFAAQMDFLDREGWHVMNLAELRSVYSSPRAPTGSGLPAKSVLICFDDLYQSVADRAAPILRRHGFSAVGFVCRDWIFAEAQARSDTHPVCLSWPEIADVRDVIELANHSSALHSRANGRTAIEDLVMADAAGDPAARTAFLADTAGCEASTGRSAVYAWPFGIAPGPAQAWVSDAGIQLAFGTRPGLNDVQCPAGDLRRSLVPQGLDLEGFATLLATGLSAAPPANRP